jgi:hypothetical protein
MAADLPSGTFVVVGSRLGRVVKAARQGAAVGYSVQTSIEAHEGSAPHFVEGYAVKVAELGVNVCRKPRGDCWCGLVHITNPELLADNHTTPKETR